MVLTKTLNIYENVKHNFFSKKEYIHKNNFFFIFFLSPLWARKIKNYRLDAVWLKRRGLTEVLQGGIIRTKYIGILGWVVAFLGMES